jgi:hypothetical protein
MPPVYPNKTKEEIARSTAESLLNEPEVKAVLGTTTKISKSMPENFYKVTPPLLNYFWGRRLLLVSFEVILTPATRPCKQ